MQGRRWNWGSVPPGSALIAWIMLVALAPDHFPHWLSGTERPGTATLFFFTLAAISLFIVRPHERSRRQVQSMPGLALAGLSLYALFRLVSVDFTPAALPGSTIDLSPTAASAFLLGGLILAAIPWATNSGIRILLLQLQLLLLCVLSLLGTGARILNQVIGFPLFEFNGRSYALDWVSVIGFALFCAGTGFTLLRSPGFRAYYRQRQDRQVFAMGVSLLLIVATATWLVGVSTFASQTMPLLRNTLQSALAANAGVFVHAIQHVNEVVEQDPQIAGLKRLVRAGTSSTELAAELQRTLDANRTSGMAAIWVRNAQGVTLAAAGERAPSEENRVRVGSRTWLFWNAAYWAEVLVPLGPPSAGQGTIVVQIRIDPINHALNVNNGLSNSGELVVCASRGDNVDCYPTRLNNRAFSTPKSINGQLLPMAHALDGKQGFGLFRDYRNRSVIAAYAPLPELRLGIVQKVDTGDINDLLLDQLSLSALLIGLLVLAGAIFLYHRVRPVVSKLADTGLHLAEAQQIGRIGSWEYVVASGALNWSRDAYRVMGLGDKINLTTLDEVFDRIPAEQQPLIRLALDATLHDGAPFDVEHQFLLPGGEHRWVHVQGQIFRDSEGKPLRMVGVTQDITERARAEARIRSREALLNEAQRIAHMGSWEYHLETRKQLWSDECFRLFGYEPGAVTPCMERVKAAILPEDLPGMLDQITTAITTHQPRNYEMRIRRPDGEIRYLYSNVALAVEGQARPARIIGTSLDITERVVAEKKLAFMARLYAVLSKANQAIVRTPDVVQLLESICRIAVEDGGFVMAWGCQVDNDKPGPPIHWGYEEGYIAQAMRIYKNQPASDGPTVRAVRERAHAICDDIATDPLIAPWRELALARGYRASAAFAIRQHGNVVALLNLYAPEPHFFSAQIVALLDDLCSDIAFALEAQRQSVLRQKADDDLRKLNDELEWRVAERTRAVEAANRELESFSYSVSHDLRAPLRSIDGFSQVLARRFHDVLDETGRDYLDRVRCASQRMGRLIDDLLKLSRVSRGPLKRRRVDLSTMAHSVFDELRRSSPERQVEIHVQEGLNVYADAGLLRILLDNLLGNAWKFTRHVAHPAITFGCREEDGRHIHFVRDNGAGFDPAYTQKLFKEFQRLHSEAEFEGTGIGLATVERIVRRHHGSVWAEGAVGQGACILFTLPQRERTRENESPSILPQPEKSTS